jgi:hypothetical protein
MGKISGTLSDESKIYVINESSGVCESSDVYPAGPYEIDHLVQSSKTIVAVNTTNGLSKSFALVTPIDTSVPIEWNTGYPGNEMTFSESNTKITRASGTTLWSYAYSLTTIPVSGKWYIEWNGFYGDTKVFGLTNALLAASDNDNFCDNAGVYCHYTSSGSVSSGTTTSTQLIPFVLGATYGMIINRDDNYIKFSKNNTWETVNTPIPSSSTPLWLFAGMYNVGSYMQVNCGQHTFVYSPPTGYTAGLYV